MIVLEEKRKLLMFRPVRLYLITDWRTSHATLQQKHALL
jgi:hypothetical protein